MIIEQYIKSLVEAAVNAAAAQDAGLALMITTDGDKIDLVLYDPRKFLQFAQENLPRTQRTARTNCSDCITGHIQMRPVPKSYGNSYSAYVINTTAALKGYGPLMYDIALGMGRPVVPDRSSVSPSAQRIWTVYKLNRSDVKKLPLDNKDAPRTPDPKDDSVVYPGDDELTNPLNFAYIRPGSNAQYSGMMERHRKVAEIVSAKVPGISLREIEELLRHGGGEFFFRRYASEDLCETHCRGSSRN